jgi:hypothetical protein
LNSEVKNQSPFLIIFNYLLKIKGQKAIRTKVSEITKFENENALLNQGGTTFS